MSTMTSFKRKRIEKWCEDVYQYLQDGTICKSVIGNIAEDAICGGDYNDPIRIGPHKSGAINDNIMENFAIINSKNPTHNHGLAISSKNLNTKVDMAFKKATQAMNSSDNNNNNTNDNNIVINRDNIISGGVGNGDGSVNIGGSFPVVKFAYSHYHEQRRKIDRLVQGLPVLNANGIASIERPASKASTEDHVPIIIVNGEEPVRSLHTRSRSSSQQPRRGDGVHGRYHRGVGGGGTGGGSPVVTASSSYLHHIQTSASSGRRNAEIPGRPSNPLHRSASGSKMCDYSRHQTNINNSSIEHGTNLTVNERVARIKTAPAPNRNLHRARQRILSRRGNRLLEHSSQIPLQNCWALAEMTW